ncbi:MAG: hypothetical protein ACJ741_19930 [Pyrinomonadaceae bacterium]
MKNTDLIRSRTARGLCVMFVVAGVFAAGAWRVRAENWGNIEPFKSRRADVLRALGKPVEEQPGETGTLRFKVQGGIITVAFVDARFVAAHHLDPALEGTVRQLILQHDAANDTAATMKLAGKSEFEHDAHGNAEIFRNQRDGIAYTFIDGKLRTTYYTAAADVFKRAQR